MFIANGTFKEYVREIASFTFAVAGIIVAIGILTVVAKCTYVATYWIINLI